MTYPLAIDENMVGEYPALTKAGGGYFFDEVLEYRVWCHPERGAVDEFDGDDYYYPFTNYEDALEFSQNNPGTEEPLVLVRQYEWIDEPEEGVFIHKTGERLTEWQVEWLGKGARQPDTIPTFLENAKKP